MTSFLCLCFVANFYAFFWCFHCILWIIVLNCLFIDVDPLKFNFHFQQKPASWFALQTIQLVFTITSTLVLCELKNLLYCDHKILKDHLWCFARHGTICTISKTWKTPMEGFLHECFSCFLNFTNGSKLRNATHAYYRISVLHETKQDWLEKEWKRSEEVKWNIEMERNWKNWKKLKKLRRKNSKTWHYLR